MYIYIYIIYTCLYILYICIYDIHNWRIIWISYRKLPRVGFETTTTEFCSDALTDWAISPWVQLALRANIVQLPHFHRLFSIRFHFGYWQYQISFRLLTSSVATFIFASFKGFQKKKITDLEVKVSCWHCSNLQPNE